METDSQERTPTEASPSSYWRGMSGFSYQGMLTDRQAWGQQSYAQQEAFLQELVKGAQEHLGRELSLLEFGCGFGRHAWYLSALPGVSYAGYDFSEEMVAPLRKAFPAGLAPIEDHLFIGQDLLETIGPRRFDFIFTVSVLIHNPPERIPGILEVLSQALVPGGTICLVENQVVPFSVYENNWHEGCWLQRFLDAIGPGWDLHLAAGFVDTHDIYILRRNGLNERRIFRVPSATRALDEGTPMTEAEVDRLGLEKLHRWARSVEPVLRSGLAELRERLWDNEEVLSAERKRLSRQKRLLTLSDDLREIRAEHPAPRPLPNAPGPPSFGSGVLLDASLDTQWAHSDVRFRRVLHVFAEEWFGIRAASGYLPGRKLAVSAGRSLTAAEWRNAIEAIRHSMARVVVIHGYSKNMAELARLVRRLEGPDPRIFLVWHGSTAQFHSDFEIESMEILLEMRRRGQLDGLACVKPHMHLISDRIHRRTLLNIAPRLNDERSARKSFGGIALVPVANDWHKNLYTNIYAALDEPRIKSVVVTAPHRALPGQAASGKVVTVPRPNRTELFSLTSQADVSLHATLSECQPMTALEALALRVPCVTRPLALEALDDHPYQQLVQASAVDAIGPVRRVLSRVIDEVHRDGEGLRDMMADYEGRLLHEALDRYAEFLGL